MGTIEGADGTPYAGQRYKLSLKFGSDYPFRPPTVRFETPCFHPNVDQYGNICLDILKASRAIRPDPKPYLTPPFVRAVRPKPSSPALLQEKWSPAYSVKAVLVSIQSLLGDPNPDSPLNEQAAQLWKSASEYARVVAVKYAEATR